jgi:hypothetical protein
MFRRIQIKRPRQFYDKVGLRRQADVCSSVPEILKSDGKVAGSPALKVPATALLPAAAGLSNLKQVYYNDYLYDDDVTEAEEAALQVAKSARNWKRFDYAVVVLLLLFIVFITIWLIVGCG